VLKNKLVLTEEVDTVEVQRYTGNDPVIGAEMLADHLSIKAGVMT
jgi:hypothetical protein